MLARISGFSLWLILLASVATLGRTAEQINESAREIPVAYEVDVVVVGGGTGAVSAAITAASEGATVFLAAPYPYLGDDMTATLRLWLEPGEVPTAPLARSIFGDEASFGPDPNRIPFTYQADAPSAPTHRDTNPPSLLTDGRWGNAANQSVQYDQDVNIVADLGKSQEIREVRVVFYRRPLDSSEGNGFEVGKVTVSTSDDGQNWNQVAAVANNLPRENVSTLSAKIDAPARHVRFSVERPEGYERMLLGEIEIVGPEKPVVEEAESTGPPPRPMHVKKSLDRALLDAGVKFLYSCMATDVLRDADGQPCGIVMANRAGRQAVLAKTIIDATPRATVARLAGAEFRPYPSGTQTFKRAVIGGETKELDFGSARVVGQPFTGPHPNAARTSSGEFPVIEYTLPLNVEDNSYAALMRADQQARSLTYHPEQQFTSDELFQVPPDPMKGRQSATGPWTGADQLPLAAMQPAGVDRIYVLGGCADVSREQAERLLRPLNLIDVGDRIGQAAAADAKSLPAPRGAALVGEPASRTMAEGEVREFLSGVRPVQQDGANVKQPLRSLPVLGRYDVLVIGGGTGGAPAGIGAARQGAKTLVIEYLHGLGGVGTQGTIAGYYWGNRVGFTATVQDGETRWVVEQRAEWYRRQLLDAGAELWFGAIGCGAFVKDNRVLGAVIATPYGRGVVLANTVIDATGNSDVAAAAGAETIYTDASEFGMQGTGLPGRKLGEAYNNTDFTIVDETDMVDIWQMFVFSKEKYPQAFDHGRLIDTRERRRIVGDFTITLSDQLNERTYPDSVVRCWSNFDTHGYTVDPMLLLEHPEKVGIAVYVPLRAMLPKGLDGIVVTGLGISSHRDAVPLIRMQPDIQNGGYAAGVAGAMVAQAGTLIRQVDIKRLQEHLVEIGNLPASVLTDKDSYPLSDERLAEAVEKLKEGRGAPVFMTDPERALPMLERAYAAAAPEHKLVYAKALAVLGNDIGLETVIAAVRQANEWDAGWNYKGMGQFGAALSELDALIIALGHTGSPKALPAVLEKLDWLHASVAFSHHRAVARALELIGDPSAAEPLAKVLAREGMSGHVHTDIHVAIAKEVPGGTNAEQTRRESLRELLLARALYRCGDHDGIGEAILRQYATDLRGHLARHATAVLEEGKP
ncbi:MAG: FAD-dependent oxidoreductase [Pirellulaceae bacterium]|nr:FAD-dependent oxidoreductase [Pirellulaceae bacterium]